MFKSQRDSARHAEEAARKKADDSRAKWVDENTARCNAQSECAVARQVLRSLAAEVARWPTDSMSEHVRLTAAARLLLDAIDHHWVGDLPTALESIAVAVNKHGTPWRESLKYEIFDALAAKRYLRPVSGPRIAVVLARVARRLLALRVRGPRSQAATE